MPIHHVQNYVEHLKGKPEPVRRMYALAIAGGITLVVALAWITALGTSGVLALSPQGQTRELAQEKSTGDAFSSLVGAAAAFRTGLSNSASLNVVDTEVSSTLDKPEDKTAEATVIPF